MRSTLIPLFAATGLALAAGAAQAATDAGSDASGAVQPADATTAAADAAPAPASDDAKADGKKAKNLNFVAVPIPISDPAIGNGLAVGVAALYKPDGSERPWTTGGGGLYTDNKSWAVVVGQKAYLAHDKYRVTAGVGGGEFHVDFYGIGPNAGSRGVGVPITQTAKGGLAEGLVRISPHLYGGLEFRYIDISTTLDFTDLPFPDLKIPEFELRSKTSALGLAGEYDTRDNEFQAHRGLYATAVFLRAATALGGDFDYTRFEAAVNGYHSLDAKSVIAWRASTCRASDSAPFYDICNFGSQSDLRGYTTGQYRDHAMYAVQAEYRRHLFWRFGGVAFAGVGEVASSYSKLNTHDLLPAGGIGLRIQASKTYGVNVRIDYAWGKDSQGAYFSVGEAF